MLLTNNLSGQAYPFLGLTGVHHGYSHNWQGREWASIARFWVEQYAYLVGKLAATQEGDGTVLDNSCIVIANEQWTAHTTERVPLLMAGGLGGAFRTGRSRDFERSGNRKFASLLMSISDRMGLRQDRFGGLDRTTWTSDRNPAARWICDRSAGAGITSVPRSSPE